MQLLDAVLHHGFGNWTEVAKFVADKSSAECEEHFEDVYVDGRSDLMKDDSWAAVNNRADGGGTVSGVVSTAFPGDKIFPTAKNI